VMKVTTQNPLILDEQSFKYDYDRKSLIVEYSSASKETIVKQQNEIKAKVKSVITTIIKPSMSMTDKEQAIHDWITANGKYQDEVLAEYMNGTSTEAIADKYASAFNPYGILIDGVGVCQSYAEVFKLLADAAGLPAVVMTGTLGSVPHAWNMVKLDGMWYHVDATNNDSGVPYVVYNSSDNLVSSNYTFGDTFELDSQIPSYKSTKDTYDYYVKKGLYASSENQLRTLIDQGFATGNDFFIKVAASISASKTEEILYAEFESNKSADAYNRYGSVMNVLAVMK
jgi:hypothetical protein